MKIAHIIISGSWAGSEACAFSIANKQAETDEVYIIVREGDNFKKLDYLKKTSPKLNLICFPKNKNSMQIIDELSNLLPCDLDIIHTHLGTATFIGKNIKNYFKSVKLVAHMHIRYYQEQFFETDGLVAVSEWQIKDIPRRYKGLYTTVKNFPSKSHEEFSLKQIQALTNKFYINSNDFVFGIISRLHIEKGVDTAIRAIKLINNPNIKLIIFGSGEELPNLQDISANDPRIHFGGFVNGGYPYMKLFNCYISPSRCESFGISQIEALFNNIPVIASKTYGSLDIFSKDNNCLFDIDNEYELSDLMIAATKDKINSAVSLEKYSADYNIYKLKEFYDIIIRNKPN